MCLSHVTETYSEEKALNKKVPGNGWKIVSVIDGNFFSSVYKFKRRRRFKKWIDSRKEHSPKNIRSTQFYYPSGFHLFPSRKAAREYIKRFLCQGTYGCTFKIVRVKYKDLVARGIQNDSIPAIVAKKIFVYPGEKIQ